MAGLNLSVGGFGGAAATTAPQYGSASSYASGTTASSAAFGSGFTVPTLGASSLNSPKQPTGLALWIGVASIAGLIFIRQSLPN